ncbi:MAG: hypothetical protein WA584_10960 [Pyrinomonadaceae bacterium]
MIIRDTQMEELSKVPLRAFEDGMVEHLAEFSPPLFNVIKEDQMRVAVRFGIEKAERYGFNLRGPIRLYLELMLLFGSHFDTDPQYPWTSKILNDQNSTPQMQRAEHLYEKTLDYQEKVSGNDAANTRKALENLSVMARNSTTISSNDFVADIRREITRVFPQKASYIGEEGLTALINEGRDEARKYRFPTDRGEALMVVLMYAFGHGCPDDPLYPWISRTLNDERIIEPTARAERLEKKAMTWLEQVLAIPYQGART